MSDNRSGNLSSNLCTLGGFLALAFAVLKAGDKLGDKLGDTLGDTVAGGMKAAAPAVGTDALKPFVAPAESLASSAAALTDLASRGWPWWVRPSVPAARNESR